MMCTGKKSFLIVVLLICLASIASSQETKQTTFTGRVVDSKDQPIAGVKVAAYEMCSDGIAGNILLRQVGDMTTAENGVFVLTGESKPARGAFLDAYIVATKQGHSLGWAVWNMREDMEQDIIIDKPDRLEGVIVDEAGKPVAGAEVRANLTRTVKTPDGREEEQWLPGIAPLEELGTKTNSQGRFFFNNLPADSGVDLLIKADSKASIYISI